MTLWPFKLDKLFLGQTYNKIGLVGRGGGKHMTYRSLLMSLLPLGNVVGMADLVRFVIDHIDYVAI